MFLVLASDYNTSHRISCFVISRSIAVITVEHLVVVVSSLMAAMSRNLLSYVLTGPLSLKKPVIPALSPMNADISHCPQLLYQMIQGHLQARNDPISSRNMSPPTVSLHQQHSSPKYSTSTKTKPTPWLLLVSSWCLSHVYVFLMQTAHDERNSIESPILAFCISQHLQPIQIIIRSSTIVWGSWHASVG